MKPLDKARQDLKKAVKKRDQTKARLEAEELIVKECEAALAESENNEYANEMREWGLTVEEVKELKAVLASTPLEEVLAIFSQKEERNTHDEPKHDKAE